MQEHTSRYVGTHPTGGLAPDGGRDRGPVAIETRGGDRREPRAERSDGGVVIGVEGGMAFVGWLHEVDGRI